MKLKILKRRRRERKTDYNLRMGLLKSELPRIVIRKTNKYFVVQIVESEEAQDKAIIGVTSKELLKYGWDEKDKGSLKSIPAGYLTGYLLAKKVKKGKYIIDMGMYRNHSGGRIYAVIKGLIDGGLEIPSNEKVFPNEASLGGKNLKKDLVKEIVKIKEGIEKNANVEKVKKTTKKKEAKK